MTTVHSSRRVVTVVLIAFACSHFGTCDNAQAKERVYRGLALTRAGAKDEADILLQEAVHLDPTHVDAFTALGANAKDKGDVDRATDYFLAATSIQPNDHRVAFNMGNMLAAVGRYTEAQRFFQHLTRVRPHWAAAHYSRAYLNLIMGRTSAACAGFQRVWGTKKDFVDVPGYEHSASAVSSITGTPCVVPELYSDDRSAQSAAALKLSVSEWNKVGVRADGSGKYIVVLTLGCDASTDGKVARESLRWLVGSIHMHYSRRENDNSAGDDANLSTTHNKEHRRRLLRIIVCSAAMSRPATLEAAMWDFVETNDCNGATTNDQAIHWASGHIGNDFVFIDRTLSVSSRGALELAALFASGYVLDLDHSFKSSGGGGGRVSGRVNGKTCENDKLEFIAATSQHVQSTVNGPCVDAFGFTDQRLNVDTLVIDVGTVTHSTAYVPTVSKQRPLLKTLQKVFRLNRVSARTVSICELPIVEHHDGHDHDHFAAMYKAVVLVINDDIDNMYSDIIDHNTYTSTTSTTNTTAACLQRLENVFNALKRKRIPTFGVHQVSSHIPRALIPRLPVTHWVVAQSADNEADLNNDLGMALGEVLWPGGDVTRAPMPKCHLRIKPQPHVPTADHPFVLEPRYKTSTRICMCVPTLSPKEVNTPQGLPFVSTFVKSFVASVDCTSPPRRGDDAHENPTFHYVLYVGYDEGDPLYDKRDGSTWKAIHDLIQGCPIQLLTFRFPPTNGGIAFLWNSLARAAYDDGCDYMYQSNDDVEFISSGWSEPFVQALSTNPVHSNFGVVGALDENNHLILTQSMVHRTHYDIHGSHFPWSMRNWHLDDWSSSVYPRNSTFHLRHLSIKNTNTFGTRYSECHEDKALYESEAASGYNKAMRWLARRQAGEENEPSR